MIIFISSPSSSQISTSLFTQLYLHFLSFRAHPWGRLRLPLRVIVNSCSSSSRDGDCEIVLMCVGMSGGIIVRGLFNNLLLRFHRYSFSVLYRRQNSAMSWFSGTSNVLPSLTFSEPPVWGLCADEPVGLGHLTFSCSLY